MKIAIIGATSQIAKDMIARFSDEHALLLFSRKANDVKDYMDDMGYTTTYRLTTKCWRGGSFTWTL